MNAVLAAAGFRRTAWRDVRGPADPPVGGYRLVASSIESTGRPFGYRRAPDDAAAPVRLTLDRTNGRRRESRPFGDTDRPRMETVRSIDYPSAADAVAAIPIDFPEAPPADWADAGALAGTAEARRVRFMRVAKSARRTYALAAVRYAINRPAVRAGLGTAFAIADAALAAAPGRWVGGPGQRQRSANARSAIEPVRAAASALRGPIPTRTVRDYGNPDPNATREQPQPDRRPRPLDNPVYRALRIVLDAADPGTDPTHPDDRLARAVESAAALCRAYGDDDGAAGVDRIADAFRTSAPAPEYRTATVRALAASAMSAGPAVLPILADALADAGYPDDALTGYLRDVPPAVPPAVAALAG